MKVLRRRVMWQSVGVQLMRLASLLLVIGLLALGLAVAVIAIQVQHDETRNVDLLLVMAPDLPSAALIDHSFDLYHRGYAVHLALVGPGRGRAKADLLTRGVPESALVVAAEGESLFTALAVARGDAQSLLVVSDPADQLLSLKVAQDQGLQAYGSPTPSASLDLLDVLRAALDYWRYVLLQV
ncbi:MAG: hypothetical protein WCF99_17080 [Chloroflexales bacterium]